MHLRCTSCSVTHGCSVYEEAYGSRAALSAERVGHAFYFHVQYTSRAAQLYRKQLEKDAAKLAQADGGLSPVGTPTGNSDDALFSSFAAPKPAISKAPTTPAAPAPVPPPEAVNGGSAAQAGQPSADGAPQAPAEGGPVVLGGGASLHRAAL